MQGHRVDRLLTVCYLPITLVFLLLTLKPPPQTHIHCTRTHTCSHTIHMQGRHVDRLLTVCYLPITLVFLLITLKMGSWTRLRLLIAYAGYSIAIFIIPIVSGAWGMRLCACVCGGWWGVQLLTLTPHVSGTWLC